MMKPCLTLVIFALILTAKSFAQDGVRNHIDAVDKPASRVPEPTERTDEAPQLTEAGMRSKLAGQYRELVNRPQGLILCTAPTDSGMDAALYGTLRMINTSQKKTVAVIQSPTYRTAGVTCLEPNASEGQSLAKVIPLALDQKPRVLFVSQIVDQETAKAACRAATGGQMVLSAVRSESVEEAIEKLCDLSNSRESAASTIVAVLGQRYVRLLCENCKEGYKPSPKLIEAAHLPADKIDLFFRTPRNAKQVCPQCQGLGYVGKTSIFELLTVTAPMRRIILENPKTSAIRQEARKNGMVYIQEEALLKVINGTTSIDEILRALPK